MHRIVVYKVSEVIFVEYFRPLCFAEDDCYYETDNIKVFDKDKVLIYWGLVQVYGELV